MTADPATPAEPGSPLEAFLRDYAEVVGGLWEEVEPQVYDLMLPEGGGPEVVRVAFDPEALPEHPGAQLASFGTPLVDRLLNDAVARGRAAELYLVGLNSTPQGLPALVGRALQLEGEELELRLGRARALHFPQAVYWFEATFVSDQKEQEVLPVAVDLHQARQVRHLDRLLDHSRLTEAPWSPLPDARHAGLARGYRFARDRVVRTVSALANARGRELAERVDRQVARMARYYADLPRRGGRAGRARPRARGGDLAPSPRAAASARPRGANPRRRAPPEGRAARPPPPEQRPDRPPAQAPGGGGRLRAAVPQRPPRTRLGPADRGPGGRRLPRLWSADVRPGGRPPRPPRLPGLRPTRPGRAAVTDQATGYVTIHPS